MTQETALIQHSIAKITRLLDKASYHLEQAQLHENEHTHAQQSWTRTGSPADTADTPNNNNSNSSNNINNSSSSKKGTQARHIWTAKQNNDMANKWCVILRDVVNH